MHKVLCNCPKPLEAKDNGSTGRVSLGNFVHIFFIRGKLMLMFSSRESKSIHL